MPEHFETIFLAAFFFPSAAAVLVFFMKYVSAVLQARVRLGQDEAYRETRGKGHGRSSRDGRCGTWRKSSPGLP